MSERRVWLCLPLMRGRDFGQKEGCSLSELYEEVLDARASMAGAATVTHAIACAIRTYKSEEWVTARDDAFLQLAYLNWGQLQAGMAEIGVFGNAKLDEGDVRLGWGTWRDKRASTGWEADWTLHIPVRTRESPAGLGNDAMRASRHLCQRAVAVRLEDGERVSYVFGGIKADGDVEAVDGPFDAARFVLEGVAPKQIPEWVDPASTALRPGSGSHLGHSVLGWVVETWNVAPSGFTILEDRSDCCRVEIATGLDAEQWSGVATADFVLKGWSVRQAGRAAFTANWRNTSLAAIGPRYRRRGS